MKEFVLGGMIMTSKSKINWEPSKNDVERSEFESKIADDIENRSLDVLRNVDDAPLEMDEIAAKKRRERPDLRLEATEEERRNIDLFMSIWGWLIVGGALAITIGVAAFFGWLRWIIFW